MTITSLTLPSTENTVQTKINEIIDEVNSGSSSSSLDIGMTVFAPFPLTNASLHLFDGTLLQYGSYQAFIDHIASIYDASASYFCSEADWQTAVSTYGVCGKFVYDSVNNTVRLPKYNSKIYTGGGEAAVKGNGKTLGLTNGNRNFGMYGATNSNLNGQETGYNTSIGTSVNGGTNLDSKTIGITSDATKSGIIADLANITTSLEGYYYIVIATTTKTAIEVDIDEIATDLNGKADTDLSNVTNTFKDTNYNASFCWGTMTSFNTTSIVMQNMALVNASQTGFSVKTGVTTPIRWRVQGYLQET